MNKGELKWMINELNERNTVIRGFAQMALECDHPVWAKKHISSIIQQIDKITALTSIISELYLGGKDDGCDSDGLSCDSTEALNNLIYGKRSTRFH